MADFDFSARTPAPQVGADDSVLARVLEGALGASDEKNRWEVRGDSHRCYLTRQEQLGRAQGWKLHVSVTPASAETVLARSLQRPVHSR